MQENVNILVRLMRYLLNRTKETPFHDRNTQKYRKTVHLIVLAIGGVVNGEISDEDLKPLIKLLDKSYIGAKIKAWYMDGGAGSGNFGHKGRPGEVGGSAPSGSADASFERLGKMRDVFASETAGCDKFDFLEEIGLIPKSETSSLKMSLGESDAAKEKRLDEIAKRYFKCAERGRQPKSLDVEIRDRVADMTLDEKRQWVADALEKSKATMPKELNQKSDAQRIAFMMGMNETPQVVSKAEFERYVSETNATVMYRGVRSIETMSAQEMQFQMAYDTSLPYLGDGIYGGCLHFSTNKSTGEGYAKNFGADGAISTCAIRPDAKVYEYDASEIRPIRKALGTREATVAAMCCGYDAVKVNEGSEFYYLIMNKASLIMQDPHEAAHEKWDGDYWYAIE